MAASSGKVHHRPLLAVYRILRGYANSPVEKRSAVGRESAQIRSEPFRVFRVFRGSSLFVRIRRPQVEDIEPRKTQKTRKPDCARTR